MSKTNMTIGFFGDSFCGDISNDHSITNNYTTYLTKVSDHFGATITNTGVGGSSVWDLVLIQFKEQIKKGLPNVCVFIWTDMQRLFDRKHRNINFRSSEYISSLEHNAAKKYFYHLYDDEKQRLEYTSLLYYFDTVVLPNYPNSKFVHLWSFGEELDLQTKERHYLYTWKNGIEIRPALELFSTIDGEELPEFDVRANHIAGEETNQQVADKIITAINYLQA
jgi:hypothetical protein